MVDINQTTRILQSNRIFKESVLNITKGYFNLSNNFISQFPNLSLDGEQSEKKTRLSENITEEFVEQYTNNRQSALTVYGPNSSGKTAFIQHFLQIGEIFPSDVGPVTARIVKLTYASAETAYLHIFSSLGNRLLKKEPIISIQFHELFLNNETPDWEKMSEILNEHLKRPNNQDEGEFVRWAKCFVEIGLPSPILQLGIDVYDTPGFLSNNRDEILNKNLHELIKSIQPTLLFLYENPAISATDEICFLTLKQALGSLENISIFFLNTKADVIGIFKNQRVNTRREVGITKFEEVLRETRLKRYKLLLEHATIANEIIGGLPESIDDCDCFDICTVPKAMTQFLEYSNLMNERTFQRIIQFAARSDAQSYHSLADQILSSIDEYFDLVLSSTYHTDDQWKQLRNQALKWAENFFEKMKETLPSIIDAIHDNILKLFDKEKESIAEAAGSYIRSEDRLGIKLPPSSNKVCDFVQIAVHEKVMKVAANEAMKASFDNIDQILHMDLSMLKKKNELLSLARRHMQLWEISSADLNRKRFFALILEHLVQAPSKIVRFLTSLRARPYLDWYNQNTDQYQLLDALDTYAQLLDEKKRQEYARQYLVKMRQNIIEQQPLFTKNLTEWIQIKQVQFHSRIDQGYQYAIDTIEQRKQAHRITKKYSENFAMLECQLIAAKHLEQFNGIRPTIFEEELLGSGGFFNVYVAQWGDQINLAVKRQLPATLVDYPNVAYMEAHYHRAITNAHQINVVPLSYLYYDNSELYIFMPKYQRSLQDYLRENIQKIQVDKILSFALVIATILNGIHQNDLVHRDIKSSNILLDQNDQCYLSDFGTAKEGALNTTVIGSLPLAPEIMVNALLQHSNITIVYDAKAVDIFSYGILLYELLPKKAYYRPASDAAYEVDKLFEDGKIYPLSNDMKDYKQLILDCLQTIAPSRPNALMIMTRIEALIQQNETKRCVVCLEQPRTVRTLPCGHKVLCQKCRNDLHSRNFDLCVVCKRLMQKDIHDDNNKTFYSKQ